MITHICIRQRITPIHSNEKNNAVNDTHRHLYFCNDPVKAPIAVETLNNEVKATAFVDNARTYSKFQHCTVGAAKKLLVMGW